MRESVPINFFSVRKREIWPEIYQGRALEPNDKAARIVDGIDCWIVQAFLLLHSRAPTHWEISFSDEIKSGAINIGHRDELHLKHGLDRGFIVGIRADRPPLVMADMIVCQNRGLASETNSLFLPHFPQPGLIPRNPILGGRMRTLAYFGRSDNISCITRSLDFRTSLEQKGVVFETRDTCWYDYSDVDAILALRGLPNIELVTKPATKLINAWLAGVPALIGPEPACRELRESDYDYIEVNSVQEILEGLERLKDATEYASFQAQAARRSKQVSQEETCNVWLATFEKEIIPCWQRWRARSQSGRRVHFLGRCLWQHVLTKKWKNQWKREKSRLDLST